MSNDLKFRVKTSDGSNAIVHACSPQAFTPCVNLDVGGGGRESSSSKRKEKVWTSPCKIARALISHPAFTIPPAAAASSMHLSNCVRVRLNPANGFEFTDLHTALPPLVDRHRLSILGVIATNAEIKRGKMGVCVYMVDEEVSRRDLHLFPDPSVQCIVSDGRGNSVTRTACYFYDSERLEHPVQVLTLSHHCEPPALFKKHPVLWTVPMPIDRSSLEVSSIHDSCTIPNGVGSSRSFVTFSNGYVLFEAQSSRKMTESSNPLHDAFIDFLLSDEILKRLQDGGDATTTTKRRSFVKRTGRNVTEYYLDTALFNEALECFNEWLRLIRTDFRLNPKNLHVSSLGAHDPDAELEFDAYVVYAVTVAPSSSSAKRRSL